MNNLLTSKHQDRSRIGIEPVLKVAAAAALIGIGGVVPAMALAAGTVEVQFVKPERYADIGLTSVERKRNLQTLSEHMGEWAARLTPGQHLQLEVLELDLAGELRPLGREPWVRILNGRIDGPRITLRWTLRDGQQVVRSGDDPLSDPFYLQRIGLTRSNTGALFYERRLLDGWFKERIVEPASASTVKPRAG